MNIDLPRKQPRKAAAAEVKAAQDDDDDDDSEEEDEKKKNQPSVKAGGQRAGRKGGKGGKGSKGGKGGKGGRGGKGGKGGKGGRGMATFDTEMVTVTVRGVADKIGPAVKAVKAIINANSQGVFQLPEEQIKALAGQRQDIDRKISKYGVTFELDEEENTASIMGGDMDTTDKAMGEVETVLRFFYPRCYIRIRIPNGNGAVNAIVGQRRQTIRALQDDSGGDATVIFDWEQNVVRVRGTEEAVATVKTAIDDLITKYERGSCEVSINPEMVSSFIGKGGENIRKLQTDHSCTIDVDRSNRSTVRQIFIIYSV